MHSDSENNPDNTPPYSIVQHLIDEAQIGLFNWDMKKNEFTVTGKITNKNVDNVKNLPYFIHQIAHKKDRQMALQDLELFLNSDEKYYESTFRIENEENTIQWIYCKGLMLDEQIMEAVIYDVTGDTFRQGHDRSTNLLNGKLFTRKLENAISYAKSTNKRGTLLYINIDNISSIINKYGYPFGSKLLVAFSQSLLSFLREEDELARFPQDKFMLYLNDVESSSEVERLSQEILDIFKEPYYIEGHEIYLTVSMGVTMFPNVSDDAEELIRYCDFAVSHARERGSNQVVFFDMKLMGAYNREIEIESELPSAVSDNELSLVFQPQIDVTQNKIMGFEALVRWHNKNLGFVSPGEFIPIAEKKGHILPIGRWIRRETIKTIRRWTDLGIEFGTISVNVSSVELEQPNLKERLLLYCSQYDVDPSKVEIEITERTLMDSTDENDNIIDELLSAGFKLALDDFGTGYSNLSSLLRFEVNTLKLDKSIIDNIRDDRQSIILEGILGWKNNLFSSIIAEGVEDLETVDILMALGFDQIQGYYFSRPLPRDEMEEFVSAFNRKRDE